MSLQREILCARRRGSDPTPFPSQPPSQPPPRVPSRLFVGKPSLSDSLSGRRTPSGEAVHVAVRVRPQFRSELGREVVVSMNPSQKTVHVRDKMGEQQTFSVDIPVWSCVGSALDGSALVTQSALYEKVGRPLLHHALDGFNSTLMAYGQTGSGKTYTMMGKVNSNLTDGDEREGSFSDSEEGIVPRLCRELFEEIQNRSLTSPSGGSLSWEVHVSFVEVYCEKISDLLNYASAVSIRDEMVGNETRFSLCGARRVPIKNTAEMLQVLRVGNKCRKTAATSVNERSSRSHSVFIVELAEILSFTKPDGDIVSVSRKCPTLRLVDLAGSERIGETGVSGHQFKEAVDINLSLFTLGMVIESLADPKRRNIKPPYRDSALTKILKDAFGGNSKTTMICTISPTDTHRAQTIQTLHYGSKARRVLNRPHVEENPPTMELRRVNEELQSLSQQLSEPKYSSREYQEVVRQLATVNENLRKEQAVSRLGKAICEQKEAELSDLRYKMGEQQRTYDRKMQVLEEEVERTKVKQKEKERELQMSRRNVEEAAAERLKELDAHYKVAGNDFRCKEKELQEKLRDAENRLKSLGNASRQRVDELLCIQKDLENKLRERERVALQQEQELQERQHRAEDEARQVEQRMIFQEEKWAQKQKILEEKMCARESELQRHQEDALEKMRSVEEEAARREDEMHRRWLEAQCLVRELQSRIDSKELDMKHQLAEDRIEARNSELELHARLRQTERDRDLQEREAGKQREQLDALQQELRIITANAIEKERKIELHWALLNEGLKKREEQMRQIEEEANAKLDEAMRMRLEWESIQREKVAETEARYEEFMGVLRSKEILIQQREDELNHLAQQMSAQSAEKELESRRKKLEFTAKIDEAELLASRERSAAQLLREKLDVVLKGVVAEMKQREGRLYSLENDMKQRYAELEGSLIERETILRQREADIMAQERIINNGTLWDNREFKMTDHDNGRLMAEARALHKLMDEDGGADAETMPELPEKRLGYSPRDCNSTTMKPIVTPSALFHWARLLLDVMERHCRSLLESSRSFECNLMKQLERAMRKTGGRTVSLPDAGDGGGLAYQDELQLRMEGLLMEEGRLSERIIEFEQQRTQQMEEFRRKDECINAYLLELEALDLEKMETYRRTEEKLEAEIAKLRRRKRILVQSVKRAWQVILEQGAAQEADYIAAQEAIERECIQCVFHMQNKLHLYQGTTKSDLESAYRLLLLKQIGLTAEERRLQDRITQQQEDEARRQERIAAEEQLIHFYLLELEEEDMRRASISKENEQRLHEAEIRCDEVQRREKAVEKMIYHLETEALERERNAQQMEDRLRQQQEEVDGRLKERIADIERHFLAASTTAEDDERTLKIMETDLDALIAKNKEIKHRIRERDTELQRQRGYYTRLKKLLEDREMLLWREHTHRINGKESATEVATDLLDVNEFLQKQLKMWIQKYQVLKTDEKLECERCSWQNNRDATVCRCCGNTELV